MDPAYRAWLDSNPGPGEVFVDTGEASAADSRKLRWSPTREQRKLLKTALDSEVAFVNKLYEDDTHKSYAKHVDGLVKEALLGVGVDPVTLKLLSDGSPPQEGNC
jgi:hypothetical protein